MRLLTLIVVLLSTLMACNSTPAELTTAPATPAASTTAVVSDKQQIVELLTTLFQATDDRDWTTVASLFTDSVQMDYSALGAEATTRSPQQIVNSWKAILPGFDLTVHQPHNFAVWVTPLTTEPEPKTRASATLDALATHYLDGKDWTVFAGYDTELIKENDAWKIARIRLSLYDQKGDTKLSEAAARRAANPSPAERSTNEVGVRSIDRMFAALEEGDVDTWINGFASDGVQRMPLAPRGFPEKVSGHDGLRKQYAPVANFDSQAYAREFLPTADQNTIVAKYTGKINVAPDKEYNNNYIGIFELNDEGKVQHFTEYFNPNILANGFPGAPPAHYSVHPAGASPNSGVQLNEVSFDSGGDQLKGHLFLPPNFNKNKKYPAVVVTGSWTSVKEQMPDEYASLLAKDGFITLTFDFRGFGESEGQPRAYEDSERKIEDIQSALTFLGKHSAVDAESLSGLGVCASSGYMAHAAARDPRIKQVALVAPWLHNPEMTEMLYGNRPGGREGLLKLGREAAAAFEQTGEIQYDQSVSELNKMAAMYVPGGAFPYYLDPAMGAGPEYANQWAVMSWVPWLTFDAISVAERIDVPVHIVHSENGAVPDGAKSFIENLPNEPTVHWLNDYNQVELYYVPEAVTAAMQHTGEWLRGQAK